MTLLTLILHQTVTAAQAVMAQLVVAEQLPQVARGGESKPASKQLTLSPNYSLTKRQENFANITRLNHFFFLPMFDLRCQHNLRILRALLIMLVFVTILAILSIFLCVAFESLADA